MAVFYTADTHFGHAAARALYRRPFATVAEMDDAMGARWNATVGPGDDVWHLGDFAVRHPDPAGLLLGLNGRKHLVTGNNDLTDVRSLPGWASVQDYAEIEDAGTALVLCHYAFRTWNGMWRGAWNLHGHSPGRLPPQTRQADAGVDAWDFRPVAFAQLKVTRRAARAR